MTLAGAIAVVACLAFQNNWRGDREMAQALRQAGVVRSTAHAVLYFEAGALPDAAMDEFARQMEAGIVEVAELTGSEIPTSPLNVMVSGEVGISHARGRSIYLPLTRVRNRTAPYLHEITHVAAPCDECALWLSEGFASWAQSYLAEHGNGYDGRIFTTRGNVAVDADARRWLARPQGKAMVEFVGSDGEPPDLRDREGTAAPLYVLAQSFVKFLVEKTGARNPQAIAARTDLAVLRSEWLAGLNTP